MKENLDYLILAVGNLCDFFVIKYKCVLGYPLDLNILENISNNQNIFILNRLLYKKVRYLTLEVFKEK